LSELGLLIEAFEDQNNVRITIEYDVKRTGSSSALRATGRAWGKWEKEAGVSVLASASVICSATHLQTSVAVALHLLYMLDARLAWLEMEEGKTAV